MITKISTETKLYKSLISDAIRRESWDNMPTNVCVKIKLVDITELHILLTLKLDQPVWATVFRQCQTVSEADEWMEW